MSPSRRHGWPLMFRYTNSDILFCDELLHTLKGIAAAVESGILRSRMMIVGKRYNYRMPAELSRDSEVRVASQSCVPCSKPPMPMAHFARFPHVQFAIKDGESADRLVHRMRPDAVPFQDDAQDFFIVMRGGFPWDDIPDFVIGRPGYDNWLVDYTFHNDVDAVDVTRTLHAIHQTGVDGNKAGHIVCIPLVMLAVVGRLILEHSSTRMSQLR
jgi:hypothetical protein